MMFLNLRSSPFKATADRDRDGPAADEGIDVPLGPIRPCHVKVGARSSSQTCSKCTLRNADAPGHESGPAISCQMSHSSTKEIPVPSQSQSHAVPREPPAVPSSSAREEVNAPTQETPSFVETRPREEPHWNQCWGRNLTQ